MQITEAMVAEHTLFTTMFDQVEQVLPTLKSRAEVNAIAAVVAGLLGSHAQLETDFAFVALDHALLGKDQVETMHREHHEMDARLHQVRPAGNCGQARRLLRVAMRASVRHFRNEERYVLPLLDRALKPKDLAVLGKAFETARVAKPSRASNGR